MTMTLGLDVGGFFEASFDDDTVRALLVGLARHAPAGPLRFARHAARWEVVEFDRLGVARALDPADPADAEVLGAVERASYAVWANSDAPIGVGPLILPGGGWDLDAVHREPGLRAETVRWHVGDVVGSDVAREYFVAPGNGAQRVLEVADRHRVLAVFR